MNSKNEYKKVERKVEQKRLVKLYIMPIATILIFASVIIFLVIPKISEIFSTLNNIATLNSESDSNLKTINSLNTLLSKRNLLLAQLDIINKTAPTANSEVVVFRDKITELCKKNSLNVVTQRLSESDINRNANNLNVSGLSLLEIPIVFEINGNFNNIIDFINDISTIEDFTIVREMSLTSSELDGHQITTLKLTIDKYQFSVLDQAKLDEQYINTPINATIDSVVDQYISSRVSN